MLFNSFDFVVLVLVAFGLYYLPALRRGQIGLLIAASLVFYGYSQPYLLALLLLSVSINIASSYLVVYGPPSQRRLHATWGVVVNLGILLFFKYSPLVGRTFFGEHDAVGAFLVSIPLPIGISFFTFQGISLVVDTFRQQHRPEYRALIPRSLLRHAERVLFFKAFFPQLVSGPIVKAHFFLPQIAPKFFREIRWEYCFRTLVLGYFLKMVVADNLKEHTALMVYPYFESQSSLTLLGLLFGYSMQIFADFAGYSLIALGLAALFGYQFPINFDFPYLSTSFAEFWRRWHISLSSFLREYLYIPLGGNRHGALRTYLNLLLTMVLGGLWHGAAWSYAVWGAVHGLALALERLFNDLVPLRLPPALRLAKGLLVFGFVTLAWLLFKLPEFRHVLAYGRAVALNWHRPHNPLPLSLIAAYSVPVLGYHGWYWLRERGLAPRRALEPVLYGLMLFLILTSSGSSTEFIYFQF